MSVDRSSNSNRPPKPTLASNRTPRTPLTPRVAATTISSARSTTPRPASVAKSEPPNPKVKVASTPVNNVLTNGNVTPRSSARSSRVESAHNSPSQGDNTPSAPRPKSIVGTSSTGTPRNGNVGGLGISDGEQNKARLNRPRSLVSENGAIGRNQSPLSRSPGFIDRSQQSPTASIDSRFFHASDAPKQRETIPKNPEPKKAATFFYADGQQEDGVDFGVASPVLSAVSEQRSTGPWLPSETFSNPPWSPPMLSPSLSALSSVSPFFGPGAGKSTHERAPSLSKENVHLSYRKGVSQIFGTKPTPGATTTGLTSTPGGPERTDSNDLAASDVSRHHKSPSVSSIDSGNSHGSRKQSATTVDVDASFVSLTREMKAATMPRVAKPPNDIPIVDTSLGSPGIRSPPETALSPTKGVSELAADARRERKVLDLEISNSSLLAINASLEREVRRQKTELKRFRRLSRAGRFSFASGEWPQRVSDELPVVGEEDDESVAIFGPSSALADFYDDMSDDEESLGSSAEPLSPTSRSRRQSDRLAKDEKRLQVDLAKHKELLVQSQAMNQSIKRCTYATEEMIRDCKKALEYHVKVSDIKLGGRVLSSHEADDSESQEIEVEDDHRDDDEAKRFLEVWTGVGRPSFEGSEGGDRDSGIEVERPPYNSLLRTYTTGLIADSGRPPGEISLGAEREPVSLS